MYAYILYISCSRRLKQQSDLIFIDNDEYFRTLLCRLGNILYGSVLAHIYILNFNAELLVLYSYTYIPPIDICVFNVRLYIFIYLFRWIHMHSHSTIHKSIFLNGYTAHTHVGEVVGEVCGTLVIHCGK